MKFSRADNCVRVWRCSDVSGTNSAPSWSLFPKRRRTCILWRSCRPEKISLNCRHETFKTYYSVANCWAGAIFGRVFHVRYEIHVWWKRAKLYHGYLMRSVSWLALIVHVIPDITELFMKLSRKGVNYYATRMLMWMSLWREAESTAPTYPRTTLSVPIFQNCCGISSLEGKRSHWRSWQKPGSAFHAVSSYTCQSNHLKLRPLIVFRCSHSRR